MDNIDSIKSQITFKNISFLILIICIVAAIIKLPDIFLLIFAGFVISSSINPMIDKLSKKMPRTVATALMIILITIITLGLFIPIIVLAVKEIKEFFVQLPTQIQNLQNYIDTLKIGNQSLASVFNLDRSLANSSTIAKNIIDNSINFTIGVFGALTVLVTLGIIVFFFSNDRDKIKNILVQLFPPRIRPAASRIMDDLETKVGGYVTAQILSITQVGVFVAVGLALLRVDYAIFLGLIAAILDLVPIVGPVITFGLIVLVAFTKGPLVCILAVFVLLFAQFVENNWAKPYFFSKYMDMHPLIVIFSFIFAASFLGVIGVILAPAIAAVIVTLFEEIYLKPMNDSASVICEEVKKEDDND